MMGPKSGDRVSEYVLADVIGTGAFGQVWKARHHIWKDQWVAIKIPTDPQYVRNLQREGAAVHGLRHENIVRAIGLDPYADPPYFAMEYIDGTSLRPLLQLGPKAFTARTAAEVARGLLRALEHAHGNGVVHRDIKPENILVAGRQRTSTEAIKSEHVRVTDFGLGLAESISTGSLMQSASLAGDAGQRLTGTIAYMAPEVRDGQAADARSDLYAVGIVLFEMLTGERPSGAESPRQLRPDLPGWTDDVFSRLYTRRERRFANATEVLAALAGIGAPPVIRSAASTVVIPAGSHARECPNCRHPSSNDDNYCINCGHQMVTQPRRCVQCGAYPDAPDRYCIFCGSALTVGVA